MEEVPAEEPTATTPEAEQLPPVIRPADGMAMVHIPEGEFVMGLDDTAFFYEKPAHVVFLDEYWIDRLEVNNAQYRRCVEDGVCGEPEAWTDVNYNADDQPAIVTWESARAYCEWAGGRLPTEAEWEKAARGTDGRIWPWGNDWEENRANVGGDEDGFDFTAPVGSFPGDSSPYGLLDVAGNAAEWVADWYDDEYYARSPASNPTGPASGEQRIHRGTIANAGGGPEKSRSAARYPSDSTWEFGVRCASSAALGEAGVAEEVAEVNPTATPEQEPTGEEEAAPTAEPTAEGAPSTRAETVDSYRLHAVMRDGDTQGPILTEMTIEWNTADSASRVVTSFDDQPAMEQITIGSQRWTRVGNSPWIEETLTAEEQADWEDQMARVQAWGTGETEEDLDAGLPEDVEIAPGQIFPMEIKSEMRPAGEETVNGVHCRKYTIDSDFEYTHELPTIGEVQYSGHSSGEMWVADQSDLPAIAIRVQMSQTMTEKSADGEETTSPYWEQDITAINEPITIEPPE